jgi:hypothetical protein
MVSEIAKKFFLARGFCEALSRLVKKLAPSRIWANK